MNNFTPIVFTAMPFGERRDPASGISIDFDDIYERAILPAIEAVNLDGIRGDEEAIGGIIMKSVYERLLLAEIVIADLTMQNPNVLYEVGVRHCAKPRTTILIFSDSAPLPFDVAAIRAVPYTLENGKLTDESSAALQTSLTERLIFAIEAPDGVDSPLAQLFPGISHVSLAHEAAETVQGRVRGLIELKKAINNAQRGSNQDAAQEILRNIEGQIGAANDANLEIFVDLLFAYRDVRSWADMIRVSDVLVANPQTHTPVIVQQRGLALNRRNDNNDRDIAERELVELIGRMGDDPETCGIIGRIHKNRYQDAAGYNEGRTNHDAAIASVMGNNPRAMGYLSKSIDWYERGFNSDPRDFYPGINEATLRFVRWRDEDIKKLETLAPALSFSVARAGGDASDDYWIRATELELQALSGDWHLAERSLERALACTPVDWMLETTANNLRLIREARRLRGENFEHDDAILLGLPG